MRLHYASYLCRESLHACAQTAHSTNVMDGLSLGLGRRCPEAIVENVPIGKIQRRKSSARCLSLRSFQHKHIVLLDHGGVDRAHSKS
jgi:hypothetical protein